MKFLFVLAQLGAAIVRKIKHEVKCTLRNMRHLLLFIHTSIENLRLCFSTEARIVINLFLNFEQK